MNSNIEQKKLLLEKLEEREKKAFKRMLLYTIVPIIIVVILIGYTSNKVLESRKSLSKLKDELKSVTEELEQAKKEVKSVRISNSLINKGIEEYYGGKYEGAVKSFNNALKNDPMNATAYVLRGSALAKLDKPQEAVNSFRQSIHIIPNQTRAYYGLALALWEVGDRLEAVEVVKKLLKIAPYSYNEFQYTGKFDEFNNVPQYRQLLNKIQEDIRFVQQTLKNLEYYKGNVDLIPGPKTQKAISDFQKDNSLEVTGTISESLVVILRERVDLQAESN
ncbi:tetratricopeptide repeat protein [Prosthecochloris sp. SCSIO W1103]|uniref:tetratricopeptide repeat protein n=1 Tax=Prosthecochloris sp. SCSIO W1103 TaxID=2992244 RepID=UPI00223DB003|nr:tetratricopeptide repeat protein [Prosthecochloris sp. SCSIO W1103]UZJ37490.1 tetratricopeptide repeat protein [Prosthecochloris sp. SCSIO W1103]